MHHVYADIFKNTPAMAAKLILSNRNRRDAQNELIRKRPKKRLLQNLPKKGKCCEIAPLRHVSKTKCIN
jgi:hypothetical protein